MSTLFNSPTSSAPPVNQNPGVSSSGSLPQGHLSIDDVKNSVPAHIRSAITQSLVDNINNINSDPIIAENVRNNFVSYAAVLKDGKYKIEEYLNAVAYASYKIMGNTNEEAYAKTFPQRYNSLVASGKSKKDISSYVSAFNKGKLVNAVIEQSLIPSWIINQDIHQRAVNRLAVLMDSAVSEKVQVEAASALLTHLAKPKEAAVQINIGQTENSGMKELREMLLQVSENQKKAIESGHMKTIDVAAQRITSGD